MLWFFMIAMILMIYFSILFLLFYCLLFFDIFSSYLTRLSISNSGCAFDSWSNFGSHLTTEWNIQTIFLWLEIVAIIFIQNVFTKTIDYHVVWMKILVCFIQAYNRRRQLSWLPDSKDSPCEDIERILWAPISLPWISSSMKVYKAMSWRLVLLRKWKWIWVPINLWWIRGSMHSGLESESDHAVLL